ncbi:ATP-binding cassette domain-containing protein [Glacieibacterium sp.]|uniref:ATP-binding cassette domain-containing protein n=1 Tax=Glacieibacterium sp. TaxID=2860237 RepID=UPI003B004CFA
MIAVRLAGRLGRDFSLDVDFEVPGQGVTALVGPSGSGKTSVLRALAGLDRHDGEVRFGDIVWQSGRSFVPAHRRRIGYVPQGPGLLPHLSVAQNLDYAAQRAGAGRFERQAIVAATGIGDLLDRQPERLSGGEAQRASIARALLSQPQLLLMDEPLSALDSDARNLLLEALERLFAAFPIPVFYVTHDRAEAERLAAQTLRINAGRIA